MREAGPPCLVRRQPRSLQQRPGFVHPQPGQPARPVRGQDHGEGRSLARRDQRAGVAMSQHPGAGRDQAEPVRCHRGASRGILGRDLPGLGEGSTQRLPFQICRLFAVRQASPLVGSQRAPYAPAQVHGGRPGRLDRGGGLRDVVAAAGGERHAERAGHAEQRSAADREAADGADQRRHVSAADPHLLGRQPGLVEQLDGRASGRIEPAQRGNVHSTSVRPDGAFARVPRRASPPAASPATAGDYRPDPDNLGRRLRDRAEGRRGRGNERGSPGRG